MAQTPWRKRLQNRVERTAKVQTSEGTTKATTPQLKGKTPPAKQAKTMKTVSIGSQKAVSTGRQKIVDTGLFTGSMETEDQKGKIA